MKKHRRITYIAMLTEERLNEVRHGKAFERLLNQILQVSEKTHKWRIFKALAISGECLDDNYSIVSPLHPRTMA